MEQVLLLLFYLWRNWGSKSLHDSPEVIQPGSGRARFESISMWAPTYMLLMSHAILYLKNGSQFWLHFGIISGASKNRCAHALSLGFQVCTSTAGTFTQNTMDLCSGRLGAPGDEYVLNKWCSVDLCNCCGPAARPTKSESLGVGSQVDRILKAPQVIWKCSQGCEPQL